MLSSYFIIFRCIIWAVCCPNQGRIVLIDKQKMVQSTAQTGIVCTIKLQFIIIKHVRISLTKLVTSLTSFFKVLLMGLKQFPQTCGISP